MCSTLVARVEMFVFKHIVTTLLHALYAKAFICSCRNMGRDRNHSTPTQTFTKAEIELNSRPGGLGGGGVQRWKRTYPVAYGVAYGRQHIVDVSSGVSVRAIVSVGHVITVEVQNIRLWPHLPPSAVGESLVPRRFSDSQSKVTALSFCLFELSSFMVFAICTVTALAVTLWQLNRICPFYRCTEPVFLVA